MLVGGDLRFPYLVLVVVLFVPLIGFFLHRKWRFAAVRREEIKRLLVLASEEAARAELEASAGYCSISTPLSVSLKPQYQCAICFFPTTTRCAKCKAVRYCSGKCQIIHWRQGHKDECRPFISIQQINDVGGSFGGKIYKQGDNKDYDDSFETEGRQSTKPVERFPEEPVFSSSGYFEGLHQKDGVESLDHVKGTESTFKSNSQSLYEGTSAFSTCSTSSVDCSSSSSKDSDKLGGLQSANVTPDTIVTKTFSEHPTLVKSLKSFSGSVKFNQAKSNFSDEDTQSGHTSSSGWTVHGSSESLWSELSTPSSGFWEGTIHSKKSRIDAHADSAPFSSSEAANEDIPDSQSSFSFSFDMAKRSVDSIKMQGSTANLSLSDETSPTTLRMKKSNDKDTSSEEICNDGLKPGRSATFTSEISKHMDVDTGSDSRISMSRETKFSTTAASHSASIAGGHSSHKDAKILDGLPSSGPEKSNSMFNNKTITSHLPKSVEVGTSLSKTVDTHLSSCTSRHLSQSTKSVKLDDGIHRVAAYSSQFVENSRSARNGLKTSMLKVVDQLRPSNLSRHCSLTAGSELAGRYSCNKGLFPYDVFVKLYHWKKVELLPCGLINCGNSCYANAVLQCLAFTPPLTAYLLQGLHSKTCEKREWCFTCEFESLIWKAKDGNSPLSPIRILSRIQNIGSHLHNGREEDAHEFLRYAIDTLQSVCLKEAGANVLGSLEEETTLIGLTFGGYLRSKINCMKCGGKSERHERMMDLTVEIEGDIRTLEEALNKFTCTEILDGENKYKCSRCKSYEKAKKKLTVLEAPNVLTIALKRFQSGKFGKLNKPIHFPEILDLAPYVSGTSDKSPIYRLYGVVVHVDVMNAAFSGHYVCYVKNVQNKWFKIDDSTVKEVEPHNVLTKGAYMLLYARCSPRAPRPIRSSLIIPHDPRKQRSPSFKSRAHSTTKLSWDDHHLNNHLSCHQNLEEDSSSSDNSSGFFSESSFSCSTESSNRDSSSNDDRILGDLERDFNSSSPPWMMNSSDSDTSSSSSSFPFPSSSSQQHSPLSDSNRYTCGSCVDHVEESDGLWSKVRSSRSSCKEECKGGGVLYSGDMMTKECRKLGCSNSCRETTNSSADRLGRTNTLKGGVSFRRSTRGRSD